MRTIFISHSAKSEAHKEYLNVVAAGLAAAGFDLFVDRHCLQGGHDWKHKIGNHMVLCQGAVVLVSRESLASDFVRYEIANLLGRWRGERDTRTGQPGFHLVPIVLPDDALPDFTRGFVADVGFTDVFHLSPRPAPQAVDDLVATFDALPDWSSVESPLASIEGQVSATLLSVPLPHLKGTALRANLEVRTTWGAEATALHLARQLLVCPLDVGTRFLAPLKPPLLDEQLLAIFELLAPAWVSAEAARQFGDTLVDRTPCVINGERPDFTPDMYLRRARKALPRVAGKVIEVAGVTDGHARWQLRTMVHRAVAHSLGLDADPFETELERTLQEEIALFISETGRPIVVTLPLAEIDLDLLVWLSADPILAGVNVVGLCPTVRDAEPLPGVRLLTPELRAGQERSAYRQYRRQRASLP